MGLSFSKLVVASSLPVENCAIMIGSDQADGSISDSEQNFSDEDAPLNFTEESSSNAVDDTDGNVVQHSYFETGSTVEKQFEGIDINIPDDMSEGSSCAPICKPLPSGHIMQVNRQPIDDGTESVFTRVSQRDASWNSASENSLGVPFYFCAKDDLNQLFTACRSGDSGIVKRLLENPDVKMDVNHDIYATMDALKLRFGIEMIATTPLILASTHGHAAVVEQLLTSSEIEINKIDRAGWTALHYACQDGHTAVVTLLLDQEGVDVNKMHDIHDIGSTPLIVAARNGHAETVRVLVARQEINVNHQYKFKDTVLMEACDEGHPDVVRVLLDHPDIDANMKDSFDKSALDRASEEAPNWWAEDEVSRIRAGRAEIVPILQDYLAQKSE